MREENHYRVGDNTGKAGFSVFIISAMASQKTHAALHHDPHCFAALPALCRKSARLQRNILHARTNYCRTNVLMARPRLAVISLFLHLCLRLSSCFSASVSASASISRLVLAHLSIFQFFVFLPWSISISCLYLPLPI